MEQELDNREFSGPIFRQRLESVVRRFPSRRQAARVAGVSVDALARYLKGSNQPGFAPVARLARATGISLDWLAGGSDRAPEQEQGIFRVPILNECQPDRDTLAEGVGHCPASLAISRRWLYYALEVEPERLAICSVMDESMSPRLTPGDLLVLERHREHPTCDGLYAISMNGAFLVKRVQLRPGHQLQFHSDHPAYESFELSRRKLAESGLYIHGRVVWLGRKI
ncbi:S24 family peptidase [Gammaproteobacteria bacterium AB-CW1]|uniref:S24 family peptidase n=1 Tax=Natronospira elongata TaxID=3110268 RepID=A0AAP6JGS2_9GAMM|nr:S24 family peptidase [Gammaproteobacteria bacterium AB-CW1]